MRALACLTVAILLISLSGCGTGAPLPPEIKLYQPIIEQKLCDDNGNCEVKSLCREYYRDQRSGEFIYVKDYELKKCHGTFGVDADNLVTIKDYCRRVQAYIEDLQRQLWELTK